MNSVSPSDIVSVGSILRVLFRLIGRRLSVQEKQLLIEASERGILTITPINGLGVCVMADNTNFMDPQDPAVAERARDAVYSLAAKGYARQEGVNYFSLTGLGFDVARRLKTRRS